MCKIYTKIDSWFQKSLEVLGRLQTSTRKSKKLKFDGLLLSKNKFVQKIYCVEIHQVTYHYITFYNTTPLYFFKLKHYIISTKVAHQSANF